MEQQTLLSRLNATDRKPLVLDVRSEAEYRGGHVPGAVNIPHSVLGQRLSELDEYLESDVVVYCEGGVRAVVAETLLKQSGFKFVYHLKGDMAGWRRNGLPQER